MSAPAYTVTSAIRSPGSEPDLAEFNARLELAMRGGMILCTLGFTREVLDALDAVRAAAPNPPKQLLDAAVDAFLRRVRPAASASRAHRNQAGTRQQLHSPVLWERLTSQMTLRVGDKASLDSTHVAPGSDHIGLWRVSLYGM